MARYPDVSLSVIRRLPRYHRFLGELVDKDVERISSREFAELIGLTASQIRQDLNSFGGFGQQGYGYNVKKLYDEIGTILGIPIQKPTIIVGAGNLGLALANHMYFTERGFDLVGIFDKDPMKIGVKVGNVEVQRMEMLSTFCQQYKPNVAILSVPQEGIQELTGELIKLGIRGIWNFSHYDLTLDFPDSSQVVIENVHLGDSLMTLGFQVGELLDDEEKAR